MLQSEWTYYCTLIPGYVEKYGLRGMRKRNSKMLRELQKTHDPDHIRNICRSLVENNLPLARYIAEYWNRRHKNPCEEVNDTFHDCVIAMSEYIHSLEEEDFNLKHFQVRLYTVMYNQLASATKQEQFENTSCSVSFDECLHSPDEEPRYGINKEFVFKLFNIAASIRSSDIIRLYYFGDEEKHTGPMDLETIGDRYGLTRERTRQLMVKAFDELRHFLTYVFNETGTTYDDFLVEVDPCRQDEYALPEPDPDTLHDPTVPPPFRGLIRPDSPGPLVPIQRLKNNRQ